MMYLYVVSEEISRRLTRIFIRNKSGRHPVYEVGKKFEEERLCAITT